MIGKTELILICLVAVALLAIAARKIKVPYPILLTIGGVVLALVPGLPAIHLEPLYRDRGPWSNVSLPVTEAVAADSIFIPLYASLSESDQARVIDAVIKVVTR